MALWERMKDFFEDPPEHTLKVGDLVTCTCHGGVAIIIRLYDDDEAAPMNMAKIWWISKPTAMQTRAWMHTIKRLSKYPPKYPLPIDRYEPIDKD